MNIESIRDKIREYEELLNPSREEKIFLAKLRSAERLESHVAPHLRAVNGHDVDFVFTETSDDATSDQLDWSGIDGLLRFRFVGIAASYANRTWTQTDETPRCGGALIRFCRDRATQRFEMALRSQRKDDLIDTDFLASSPGAGEYLSARPVRFQEEAVKFLSSEFMGLPSSFSPDYFISSYFDRREHGGACARFSVVPVRELCSALAEIFSEITVGNRSLLSLSQDMVRHWRAPYLLELEEFRQIEAALEAHPNASLVNKKDGPQKKLVRFLYLRREFLEARCPSFQIWEGGALQPRPVAVSRANSSEAVPTVVEIHRPPSEKGLIDPDDHLAPIQLAPVGTVSSQIPRRRRRGSTIAAIIAGVVVIGLGWMLAADPQIPPAPLKSSAADLVAVGPTIETSIQAAAPPGPVVLPKKRLYPVPAVPPEVSGVMTARTAPAIREAARQALAGGSVRWVSGIAFGFATLASTGTFDAQGCPRFRISRNDLVPINFQEYTLCEVLVPK